jgi:DNA-binding NtrC family response regulator
MIAGPDAPNILSLKGKRVLVVEDEYYIADELERILNNIGAEVVGPVGTFQAAVRALREDTFDCAVIDLNLHGESAVPIADQLMERGASFAIATGYGSPAVPQRLRQVPRIEKPYDPAALVQLVAQLSCAKVD